MIAAAVLILIFSLNQTIQKTSFGCTCGEDKKNEDHAVFQDRDYANRIIGGMRIYSWNPWFVHLSLGTHGPKCGASLLNREWVVTAAICICNYRIGFDCVKEDGRIVIKGSQLSEIQMFFGSVTGTFRRPEKIVVHEDYEPDIPGKTNHESYNNIALIKFKWMGDRPFNPQTIKKVGMMPICITKSQKITDDEGKGYTVGLGLKKQEKCRTNGIGPDIYHECAKTTIYSYKGKNGKNGKRGKKTMKLPKYGCLKSTSPSMDHKTPCYYFNKKMARHFQPNITDEVFLIPPGKRKSMKDATKCMRSNKEKNKKGQRPGSEFGWCGTIPQTQRWIHGAPLKDPFEKSVATPTVDSGWGYCTDDCKGKDGIFAGGKLQIVNLDLLRSDDCQKLLEGTNAPKVLDENKQLCAGHKIEPESKSPKFFTYSWKRYKSKRDGKYYNKMVFKEIEDPPLHSSEEYQEPAHMSTVPGLDWMIGGKDACSGDWGGPLWKIRKSKAYLVGITDSGSGIGRTCGGVNQPGLYVRVKKYYKWIKKHADSNLCTECKDEKTCKCKNGKQCVPRHDPEMEAVCWECPKTEKKKKEKKSCTKSNCNKKCKKGGKRGKRKCNKKGKCVCSTKKKKRRTTRTTKIKRRTTRTSRSKRRSKRRKG